MASSRRLLRINKAFGREVSEIIQRELKDPRLGFVTVTNCKVTPDLKEARIYVSVLEKEKRKKAIKVLQHASGFIQSLMGKRVRMRYNPRITFFLDETIEKASRIEELLEKIKQNP